MPHYAVVTDTGDLVFEFARQQRSYCLQLGAGTCVDVEIREHRAKRSDRQNRALWALLTAWCLEADQGWRPDELKEVMLGRVFGTIERVQPLTGEIVKVNAEPSSSKLNVTKFCALIEGILETAAESTPSVFLLAPDEFLRARDIERRKREKAAAKAA